MSMLCCGHEGRLNAIQATKKAVLCVPFLLFARVAGITSPVDFSVNATSSSSLFLTWKSNVDDLGSILSYRLQYKKSADTEFAWFMLDSSATNYTISKLDANTAYEVSLQALGLFDVGPIQNRSATTCPGVPSNFGLLNIYQRSERGLWGSLVPLRTWIIPGPVSRISLLKATRESVEFTWDNPTSYFGTSNSTIIEYWTPGEKNKIVSVEASTTTCKLVGLNATLPYYVNLAASTNPDSNSCGGGPGVGILGGLFYTTSDAEFTPVGGTLKVTGPSSLRREWDAPNTSDPRILALTYIVTGGTRDAQIVPGMPTDLNVTKQGSNALKVQWSAPTNPPGTVKEYACSLYSGDVLAQTKYVETTQHTFSDLSAEGVYKVTVAASIDPNSEGLGGGSGPAAESDLIYMTDLSKPKLNPPTNLIVEAAGTNAISVKWDSPVQDTVGVYGYSIIFTDTESQTMSRFVSSHLNFYLMTGLKSGESYKVAMKSIGLLQDSVLSEVKEVATLVAAPSPPQKVRATIVLPNTAEVTWSAPAQSSDAVTGYVVEAVRGGTVLGTQKVPSDTLKAAFVLPSYVEVTFLVAAESASGVSASAASNAVFTDGESLFLSFNPSFSTPSLPASPKLKALMSLNADFPFLEDGEMNKWISNTRFMIILRGPAGPGKEVLARSIRSRFPSAKLCSDAGKPNSGARWRAADKDPCLGSVETFTAAGYSPIVIDSLVEQAADWEGKPYVDLAMKNDYNVLLVVAQTPGATAPKVRSLLHSETQGLPSGLAEKLRSLAPVYPLYYGWFWPARRNCNDKACSQDQDLWDVDPSRETRDLVNISKHAFDTILNNDSLRATLAKTCGLSADSQAPEVADFWKSAVNPHFGNSPPENQGYPTPTRPHVTSYYSNFGSQPGAQDYADLLIVNEALLGRLDSISVLGLVVSKRTVGARLKLSHDMLPLWRQDDSAAVSGSLGRDRPSRPLGSRAHATLALAKGISAVETGFDTMRVVDAESQGYPNTEKIPIKDGFIYDITIPSPASGKAAEHMFYYEFTTPPSARVIFTSFY
ncbi:unnamed protein product [Schistocephalus solidus]|uniref:Protein-tyrosine-phosphatase n=1 Tax=Schistocephalus solidus TaxID=70667 RepID=A0A183T6X5_SCHSO|nr:unnamed protein product [Schistocephalus solidus]